MHRWLLLLVFVDMKIRMKQEQGVTQMIKKDLAGTDRDRTTMVGVEVQLLFKLVQSEEWPKMI